MTGKCAKNSNPKPAKNGRKCDAVVQVGIGSKGKGEGKPVNERKGGRGGPDGGDAEVGRRGRRRHGGGAIEEGPQCV